MLIDLPSGKRARLIGDPHLGLKFEMGVPLHRRGEREKLQFAKFVEALNTPDVDYNICVGDLFEHPFVGHGVVLDAVNAYRKAAENQPDTSFFVIAGNHDLPRNRTMRGALDTFTAATAKDSRISVICERPHVVGSDIILLPWNWANPVRSYVEGYDGEAPDVAVGHCDLRSYGGDESHLYPTKRLSELGVIRFYGGHYHVPGEYVVDGLVVNCTGSLEPYSHGEDPDEEIYVTRTLDEVQADPELYKNKSVRVLMKPGEEVPDLDCFAIVPKYQLEETPEIPEIRMEGFDWDKVLEHELSSIDDEEVRTFIADRL